MPSSINSTSSSPGGIITTGATDNELVIQTGDTTAISIDASQNVTVAGDLTVNGTLVGGGDVVGPASATDNAIARYDGTTGKLIQNSGVAIDDSNNVTGIANLSFNSGYGSSAVAYGCRAWVNFNGTGTVAIRASGNVSSITDNATGQYTINFTTAMPDVNYAAIGTSGYLGADTMVLGVLDTSITTGNFSIALEDVDAAYRDQANVMLAVFR